MEHHVFAVWDFMSLLKRLQHEVAGCRLPWVPPADASAARFVNEIVLGEECDDDGQGGIASHFELYLAAMEEVGADTGILERFLDRVRSGDSVEEAFADLPLTDAVRSFVVGNLKLAAEGHSHEVAAAFCFGREDVIPEMFERLAATLREQGHPAARLIWYLQRHIELDGDEHGPMARRLLEGLCGDSPQKWEEATRAADAALRSRIDLWDGIAAALDAG